MKNLTCLFKSMALASVLASCNYIHDDLEPCPSGLYLTFEYDYNLQRADMFADHVGSVTAYVFDQNGVFLTSKTESGSQLAEDGYEMQLELQPGHYQYVVLAGQKPFDEMLATPGAKFRIDEPAVGEEMHALSVTLDHEADGSIPHATGAGGSRARPDYPRHGFPRPRYEADSHRPPRPRPSGGYRCRQLRLPYLRQQREALVGQLCGRDGRTNLYALPDMDFFEQTGYRRPDA